VGTNNVKEKSRTSANMAGLSHGMARVHAAEYGKQRIAMHGVTTRPWYLDL